MENPLAAPAAAAAEPALLRCEDDPVPEGKEALRAIDGGRKYESKEYWDKRCVSMLRECSNSHTNLCGWQVRNLGRGAVRMASQLRGPLRGSRGCRAHGRREQAAEPHSHARLRQQPVQRRHVRRGLRGSAVRPFVVADLAFVVVRTSSTRTSQTSASNRWPKPTPNGTR